MQLFTSLGHAGRNLSATSD